VSSKLGNIATPFTKPTGRYAAGVARMNMVRKEKKTTDATRANASVLPATVSSWPLVCQMV